MATVDSLPPDQRAVLQLVLQRGRSYDDIAELLSIDRAAVRQRALAALDALGPQTRLAPERRALITDYLLGQLPGPVSDDTRNSLAGSAGERAWARVVASELAPLAG
ncbi:MAG TPA: sigma factor-like helix-turn-helix DNA-binding protein, partial [Solirubrobacteraceae bacterium]|nr:sigma factor-like helix-turn-helix DNA-binding protein [Solirubrobacteraceae bacterium]